MNIQTQNFPTHINGHKIIGIVSGKENMNSSEFQGMIDRNDRLFIEEHNRYHLGLLDVWGNQDRESYPMMEKVLKSSSEIKVNGFHGEFTFDKPFYDTKKGLKTVASTEDEAGPLPGYEGSEFDIITSERCYPNETLTTDTASPDPRKQLIVTNCESSGLIGEGWRTTVRMTTDDREASYDTSLLAANVAYYKTDVVGVEYTTQFGGVDVPTGAPTGFLTAKFKLGGIRGVEGTVTGFADAIRSGFAAANSDDAQQAAYELQMRHAEGNTSANMIIFGEGKDWQNYRACTLMEYLVEKTLMNRTYTSHLWQKAGMVKNTNGAITYLNEGIWHQLNRGKKITFTKYMGITKAHLAEAANYCYLDNPNLPWEERHIVFEGGKTGIENLQLLFQNEIQQHFTVLSQTGVLATLFGDSGVLSPKLKGEFVTGSSLNELEINKFLKFTSIPIVGIAGKVEFRHNPALDHMPGPKENNFPNGLSWTSHSLIVWDVTDNQYVKRPIKANVRGSEDSLKLKDNLYLVRPEDGMTYKGYENGRWDRGKSNIVSSSKVIAQNFWAFNSSSQFVPYPDRVVMIELAKSARQTGYIPFNY